MLRRSVFVTPLNNCNFIENKYFIRKFGGKWKSDHSIFSLFGNFGELWAISQNLSFLTQYYIFMEFLVWGKEVCPAFFPSIFQVFSKFSYFFLFFLLSFPLKMNHLKQICQKWMSAITTSHSLNLWLCIVKIQVPVCHQFLAVLLTPSIIWLFS